MRQLLRRAWYLIRRRRFDADLREELEFHRASIERELQEGGVESTEARFAARRAIGSVALAQDHAHDVWVPRAFQGLGQDVRLAFRTLRTTPVVSAVVVLSLALGIGANTAIFSLVNGLILRPLPVSQPEQLALVDDGAYPTFSHPVWAEIRRHQELFAGAGAWSTPRFNLNGGGEADLVDGLWASGGLFDMLGVRPLVGRLFSDADDQREGGASGAVVVLSYGFWQRRFGGMSDVVGHQLRVEGADFTIVGVAPPEFTGPDIGRAFDIALPINARRLLGSSALLDDPTSRTLSIMIRRTPDQSLERATAMIRAIQPQIRAITLPRHDRGSGDESYLSTPWILSDAAHGRSALRVRFERPLVALWIIVTFVLLIACSNVANLLLVRTIARQHEWGVRRALGATRWRLVRPLVLESFTLAAAGTLTGVFFARGATSLLVGQLSTSLSRVSLDLSFDRRVFLFTIGVLCATTILFGIAPAWHASGARSKQALKEHERQMTTREGRSAAAALVVTQVVFLMVLIVGTGLFVRTFTALLNRNIGFDSHGLLIVTITAPPGLREPAARLDLYERSIEAVRHVPGVVSAGASVFSPLSGPSSTQLVAVNGEAPPQVSSMVHWVTPDWFSAYHTPLLAGRDFQPADRIDSAPVAIVNEAFVKQFLAGRSALGRFIQSTAGASPEPPREVVGVLADAVYLSVREDPRPTVYFPLAQVALPYRSLMYSSINMGVRVAAGSPLTVSRSMGSAVSAVSPDVSLAFRSMADQVGAGLAQERLLAILSGFFGALGLLLAALGLFGIVAYDVARRRTELGVRMALGAAPASVVLLVLSRVATLVGIGVLVGTVVSLWASKFVVTLLYGLQPRDPSTLISAVAILATVAALASWIPACASRIDPAMVLRNE